MNQSRSIEGFAADMHRAGLSCGDELIPDGKIHRFHVAGDKAGSLNGWYVIFSDLVVAGAYGSWKRGEKYTWSAKGIRLSDEIREKLNAQLAKARSDYKIERHKEHLSVAQLSQEKWFNAAPANAQHPYLVKKCVRAHGLRQVKNHLLLPLMDFHTKIWNLQTIYANGDKRFESGGRVSGMFCPIGAKSLGGFSKLTICEGWATGASLHEVLGEVVLCAMNAGNLVNVAEGAREHFPDAEIIIAADNDVHTPGNPGLTKALEAGWLIQATVMSPQFPAGVEGTDFNDAVRLGWRGA
jgi:putative DNA primase/helicase